MAYDEELASRVRDALAKRTDFEEKKMFGGLAFMVNTHMACGLIRDDLMVRVGIANFEAALHRGAAAMEFTGRRMTGMVMVPGPSVASEDALEDWVRTAVEVALSEPPKKPKRAPA